MRMAALSLKRLCLLMLFATLGTVAGKPATADDTVTATYQVSPIGWVRHADGKTFIEIEPRYQPALLGVEELEAIWVLYWFDRNDTPEQRSILQVHPRNNPDNPLRGVFATRAPLRPNLIALSRCRVLSVHDNIIEIDQIDAYPDTPVLDIKR
jgi:tRNA-Thr(GGU) m(6)t(6)A37 methyltransferase TsaA